MEKISPALLNLLLNACWQIAVIAIAAELSTRLLHSSARERHRIWVAALVLSIGLPLLQASRPLPFRWKHRGATPTTTKSTPSVPVFSIQYAPLEEPVHIAQPKESHAIPPILAIAVCALYLAIVVARALMLLRAWWSTRRLLKSAREVEISGVVERVFARCLETTSIARVRVLTCKDVASPITLGFAPAAVVVPESLLREEDEALLTTAIGHELVHIDRKDYLLNLLYRTMAVPLSFHPAAWFIQRRIEQTRELRCDEVVTERLLSPTAYARSLVELAGQAMRPAATVAVGIGDADILEERIMFMLKKPKHSSAKRALLFSTAALVFAAPCIAAAPYALHVNVQQEAAATTAVNIGHVDYTPAGEQVQPAVSAAQQEGQQPSEQTQKPKTLMVRSDGQDVAAVAFTQQEKSAADGQDLIKRKIRDEYRLDDERNLTPEERAAREKLLVEALAMRKRQLAELSKAAKITMQEAIDTATREVPGKVFESGLVGQRRFITKQADGSVTENVMGDANPQYRIVILAGDENNPERHIVFVDAVNGSVVRSVVE